MAYRILAIAMALLLFSPTGLRSAGAKPKRVPIAPATKMEKRETRSDKKPKSSVKAANAESPELTLDLGDPQAPSASPPAEPAPGPAEKASDPKDAEKGPSPIAKAPETECGSPESNGQDGAEKEGQGTQEKSKPDAKTPKSESKEDSGKTGESEASDAKEEKEAADSKGEIEKFVDAVITFTTNDDAPIFLKADEGCESQENTDEKPILTDSPRGNEVDDPTEIPEETGPDESLQTEKAPKPESDGPELLPFDELEVKPLKPKPAKRKPVTPKVKPEPGNAPEGQAEAKQKGSHPEAQTQLSPELVALRGKVREAMAYHFERPPSVNDRTSWGIMHYMLAFGVDSQILDAAGNPHNAVGYLSYNYSCKGKRLFFLDKGRIAAKIAPGVQGHQGQFLAMLAQSRVSPAYPVRIEGKSFTVSDLIEFEKRTCRSDAELTFKLIAFSHYLRPDETWLNDRGEPWNLSKIIETELKQPIKGAACGGTHRMMGFTYAAKTLEDRGGVPEGQWLRARKFVDSFHDYALTLQNPDGSFSTSWFEGRAANPDVQRRLQTTGHILEWLVYSLPNARLTEPQVVKSVDYIATLLNEGHHIEWEIGPLGHSLHALAIYDERLFGGKPGARAQQLARVPHSKEAKRTR